MTQYSAENFKWKFSDDRTTDPNTMVGCAMKWGLTKECLYYDNL